MCININLERNSPALILQGVSNGNYQYSLGLEGLYTHYKVKNREKT